MLETSVHMGLLPEGDNLGNKVLGGVGLFNNYFYLFKMLMVDVSINSEQPL